MIIDKRPIAYNYSKRRDNIKYIVIHDTGNKRKGAGAIAHYKYFNGGNRNASAHYFVDDSNILETVEVSLASWHCGDGKGRKGVTNQNSIGIEICVNEDSDFNMAMLQAIELTRFLKDTYRIEKKNIIRHYDASGKICPASMSADSWSLWEEFWSRI